MVRARSDSIASKKIGRGERPMQEDLIEWEEYFKGRWNKREATESAVREHVRCLMRAIAQPADPVTWVECINRKKVTREGPVAVVRDLIRRLTAVLASHSEYPLAEEGPQNRLTLSVE